MIYCLAEGATFSNQGDNCLGPFEVDVYKIGELREARQLEQRYAVAGAKARFYLYAQIFPVEDAGDYAVELRPLAKARGDSNPQVIARATIHVSGAGPLPWSPFSEDCDPNLPVPDTDNDAISMVVSNPHGGTALPQGPRDGFPLDQLPLRHQPLPRMTQENTGPHALLKMVKSTLIVTPAEGIDDSYPDDFFLTRWWVNDKPFMPDPTKIEAARARAEARQARAGGYKEIDLVLNFYPERIGAKKGDKIGVQLLVCPSGWQYTGPDEEAMPAEAASQLSPLTDFSYATPRIDFIYSGDPKAPQQK